MGDEYRPIKPELAVGKLRCAFLYYLNDQMYHSMNGSPKFSGLIYVLSLHSQVIFQYFGFSASIYNSTTYYQMEKETGLP